MKAPSAFTDTRLKTIRAKLIKRSYLGYMLYDRLQIGIDKDNRVLQFDTGAMKYTAPKKGQINKRPFTINNKEWLFLLKKIHKNPEKYGLIERNSRMDNYYLQNICS
ncbi:hypothetical protein [Methanosarcina sp.]|uniref:hypothetical protein n=1 Tax=Methanosarcina sp. TaxID=2213 RepID=UPI0029894477|nr:hypothetical protein [Methanosarcina sp.]MDW5550737.1 hypothetical protein [Methanosarcina sp.]MDW5553271.1 hypothetical protein [Methanosarcina sp.]MDW5558265.1 hypothetical protein [Methanosarcina sp.]